MSRINPSPERSINIEDYSGKPIRNRIDADPSKNAITLSEKSPYHRLAISRPLPPSGRYNCHGLVFGCRRTNIDSPDAPVNLDELLESDRYQRISGIEPQPGDIVVYRHSTSGKIEHSGFVIRIDKMNSVSIVIIWSKWGALGEYVHQVKSCKYSEDCHIEYWRLL